MVERTISDEKVINAIEKYVKVICENYNIYTIIVFGSYAKGTESKYSDIDIAIITDDIKTNIFDEQLKMMKLRRGIDSRIEPHIISIDDYKNIDTPFVQEVIDTGIKVA